jgi:hypothetical protein
VSQAGLYFLNFRAQARRVITAQHAGLLKELGLMNEPEQVEAGQCDPGQIPAGPTQRRT